MSHSTLANTSWEFPATGFNPTDIYAALTFQSAGNTYSRIFTVETLGGGAALEYGSTLVWDAGWVSDDYRTVDITGGTDATDADVIAWFEAMATEIPTPAQRTVYTVTGAELTQVADAIRFQFESSDLLEFPTDFVDAIRLLPPVWMNVPCGFIVGSAKGTTYTTLGSNSSLPVTAEVFPYYLAYQSGVFTVLQPGDYTLNCYARGGYTSSGSAVSCWFKIYKNSDTVRTEISGTTYQNAGGVFTVPLMDLSHGDTFKVEVRASTGSTNSVTFGIGITARIRL